MWEKLEYESEFIILRLTSPRPVLCLLNTIITKSALYSGEKQN